MGSGRNQQLVQRLFSKFAERSFLSREKTIEGCQQILDDLTLAFQHRFAQMLADPLLAPFAEEKDPKILRDMASLLHRMAVHLIHFADYPLASRILLLLHRRYQQLIDTKEVYAQRLAKILDRKLDPAIQKILFDDLRSGESAREEKAALLLGSLGRTSAPLLIDLVKKAGPLRIREMAANLLGKMGPEATEPLKRELVLANSIEEKVRIIEVIDTVTRDLKMELRFVLKDENEKVREAALRLMERLNSSQAAELLLEYARSQEPARAVEAIESLGKLKTALAVDPIISLLKESKDKNWLVACCRSLGQLADSAAIDPLAKILAHRNRFFPGKKKMMEVRAAAAFALAQIPHQRVIQSFASLVKDRDPRIREIARLRMAST
ncbi:MAG: HEAT repeat domain-containing protein, partial [Deltaproteobacteria bacterium]|nr:HEAT repeat domain-containing protein [Deltaproteobacteria bacterium]